MSKSDKPSMAGVITADPLAGLPIGLTLKIVTHTFPPIAADARGPWSHFRGTVAKLGFKTTDAFKVTGSGVFVAPAVILMAKHVIEDELPDLHRGSCASYILAANVQGLDIWQPIDVVTHHKSDLALITLRHGLRCQLMPPSIKPPLQFGYPLSASR